MNVLLYLQRKAGVTEDVSFVRPFLTLALRFAHIWKVRFSGLRKKSSQCPFAPDPCSAILTPCVASEGPNRFSHLVLNHTFLFNGIFEKYTLSQAFLLLR